MPLFNVRVLEGPRVQIMRKHTQDFTDLLPRVGKYLVSETKAAFDRQSFDGKGWAPRHAPSTLGIVADLAAGKLPRADRFTSRPALVNTGALRNSISYALAGKKSVKILCGSPYGQLMHAGGASSVPVTATVRQGLKDLLRGNQELRKKLGFIFNKKTTSVSTVVPARPFMGVSAKAREKIKDMVKRFLGQRSDVG